MIAKIRDCRPGQSEAITLAAARAAVQAAAAADVAVASSGLSVVKHMAADCWVLLMAYTEESTAEALAAAITASGECVLTF
jgi:hypothetical protein